MEFSIKEDNGSLVLTIKDTANTRTRKAADEISRGLLGALDCSEKMGLNWGHFENMAAALGMLVHEMVDALQQGKKEGAKDA